MFRANWITLCKVILSSLEPACSQVVSCVHVSQTCVVQVKGEGENSALHPLLTFAGFWGLASCPLIYKKAEVWVSRKHRSAD